MSPTALLLDPVARLSVAVLLAAAYAALCGAVMLRERRRRAARSRLTLAAEGSPNWLVAYASQTGAAETIALETARCLHQAGLSVRVLELNQLETTQLRASERVLFVVSTYGEGDAPDNAALFATHVMTQSPSLAGVHFAILALGDASYAHYCGFGRALDRWLLSCGALSLSARIEMDRGDREALRAWQALLSHLAGSSDAPDWTAPEFETWRLAARRLLNAGSRGAPLYEIELQPALAALPTWESGDLAQLRVSPDDERPRDYSIASLPTEACVRLLVRLHYDADGKVGLSSGWLANAEIGSTAGLRVHPHRLFRLEANATRPLILIGNGSGLAGLRAHIKARALVGQRENWLIYGERNAATDAIWAEELLGWQADGTLQQLDRVYSRDGDRQRYVQDALLARPEMLRAWVEAGAAIYVCGSRKGMAEGVDAAMLMLLGTEKLAALQRSGRYRRDVY